MKYKTLKTLGITQDTYRAMRFIMRNGWLVNLNRQYRTCSVRSLMGNECLRRYLRFDLERMDPPKANCVFHVATAMTAGTQIPNVQKPFSSEDGNWIELNNRWNAQLFGFTTASIIYRIDGSSCTAGTGQQTTETDTI